jgi:hypothetical protein
VGEMSFISGGILSIVYFLVNHDFSEASSASFFRQGKHLFLLRFIKKSDDGQRPKK